VIPTTRYFRHQHLRGRADCLGRSIKLTARLRAVHLQHFFYIYVSFTSSWLSARHRSHLLIRFISIVWRGGWGNLRICEVQTFEKATECHVFYSEECWLEACWSGTKFNYWSHSEGRVFTVGWPGRWGEVVLFALSVLDHSDQYCLHHLCRVLAPGIVMFLFHTVDCRSCQKYCSAFVYFTGFFKYGCEKRETRRTHIILHFRKRCIV